MNRDLLSAVEMALSVDVVATYLNSESALGKRRDYQRARSIRLRHGHVAPFGAVSSRRSVNNKLAQ